MREAVEDLKANIMDVITVSARSVLKTDNGEQDFHQVIGTETYFIIPEAGITITEMDGYYLAKIEKDKVRHVDGQWTEQNIVINNTYNAPTTYSRGFRRESSITRTERKRNIISPRKKVVDSVQGKTTVTKRMNAWNGRYGWNYESTK